MHLSLVALGAWAATAAAANPHPWMYGVPDYPDLDMEEVMTQAGVDLVSNVEAAAADPILSVNEAAVAAAAPPPVVVVAGDGAANSTKTAASPNPVVVVAGGAASGSSSGTPASSNPVVVVAGASPGNSTGASSSPVVVVAGASPGNSTGASSSPVVVVAGASSGNSTGAPASSSPIVVIAGEGSSSAPSGPASPSGSAAPPSLNVPSGSNAPSDSTTPAGSFTPSGSSAQSNSTTPSGQTSPSGSAAPSGSSMPRPSSSPAQADSGACAAISRAIASAPSNARKVIPAELGAMCLMSVPLDTAGNIKLIDDIKLFTKWQSNVAYLKTPPTYYTEEPLDIVGELDAMQRGLSMGEFKTEYDFQMKMMMMFNRAYDNHFAYQPDILASAMQFQRPPGTELVSVSANGIDMPQIFTYQDIRKANNNTSFDPSPVVKINGMDVKEYLTGASNQSDFHDADTRWNALFPSQALIAAGTTYLGSFRTGQYQGPNTTMEFANGTVFNQMNLAVVFGNFTDLNSGADFFQRFCTGPKPADLEPVAVQSPPTMTEGGAPPPKPQVSHIGYPQAVIINPNRAVGGYFINGTDYSDVAVLSIPSYESPDVQSFQSVMRDFIRMCKAQGKTKMIFDMRGNGGGNAILGYDSFKQVYPQADKEPFGGTRFRANDALNSAGQLTSDFLANKTFAQSNQTAFAQAFGAGTTQDDIFGITAGINYQHQLDINNQPIASWQSSFGPKQFNGDNFTSVVRYNFTDGVSTSYTGFSIIGYGDNANETKTPQPFKAQDMVMLHDGMCSSTCAIAAELLKNQGAVRTIAVGGRPQNGPMQGVGGTKGAQVFSWDDIQLRMQATYALGSPQQRAAWDKTDLGKTAFAKQLFIRSAYSGGRVAGGVNLKDNLRKDDESGMPLEFMYEAADCRMWFTAPMISDVTVLWKGVADRMFRNSNATGGCVAGSTLHPTSVSAGGQKRAGDGTITGGPDSKGAVQHVGLAWVVVLAGVVGLLLL